MQYKKYTNNLRQSAPTRRSTKKRLFLLAAILLLAAGVLATLELTDTTHIFHKKPVPQVTGGPGTKGTGDESASSSDTSSSTAGSGNDNTTVPDDETSKLPTNTSKKLIAPQGPFVSNHAPSAAHPTINSACNTTSGATCQILFTKDGVTKTLPAQTTDLGGATYWNGWKPKDIGLTPGEWKITAKVSLGSQTKTAADALPLKITE